MSKINIFDINFENWYTLKVSMNWLAIIILVLMIIILTYIIKHLNYFVNKKSIMINEINLGIGNSSVKLLYNKKDKEIAYKLWVELSTRKIGIPFDKDCDVITEIYNSWYEFFKIARELLKDVPVEKIQSSNNLIELTENVLNKGLRPHLTKWQAKYRKWYENQQPGNNLSPQEIQKSYPEYNELIVDIDETNKKMIEYKNLMHKIAFEK